MSDLARCEKKRCRETLTLRGFDDFGRLVLVCEPCERNRAGKCRRCPTGSLLRHPRGGYAGGKFCPKCRKAVDLERWRRDMKVHRDRRNMQSRQWRKRNRKYVNARAREWRRTHPTDALDTLYNSVKGKQRRRDPVAHAHDLQRQRDRYRRRMQDPTWVEKERQRCRRRYQPKREAVAA